ncbi:uncharacterized protein BJ171DRAFT_564818 [Polychytrium aggregatum]|uniref:uncharacterized protein n=1 Tax=Polychytrium aggregatum TaxID=110093 RepID=UPI0022FEEB52|nr:uncharacterized protein BJ171DRAFT_564818 [Polychytrium aggregatum]KAI9208974.1 hypothetical protein BJ171DRAFT_564818 [Polychytrium aggregatum]
MIFNAGFVLAALIALSGAVESASVPSPGKWDQYRNSLDKVIGSSANTAKMAADASNLYKGYLAQKKDATFQGLVKQVKTYSNSNKNAAKVVLTTKGVSSIATQVFGSNASDVHSEAVLAALLPTSWDSRTKNWVSSIKDQGQCGSCVAFSSAATVESTFLSQTGNSIEVSTADLFFCLGSGDGASCNTGWETGEAANDIAQNGVVSADCFPYTAGDGQDQQCDDSDCPRTGGLSDTSFSSVNQIKQHIMTYGAVVTAFTVYADFMNCCSNNQIYSKHSSQVEGGHAVSIVGWNDSKKAWLCKNSWTDSWGTDGFFWIKYGQCGIGSTSETYGFTYSGN